MFGDSVVAGGLEYLRFGNVSIIIIHAMYMYVQTRVVISKKGHGDKPSLSYRPKPSAYHKLHQTIDSICLGVVIRYQLKLVVKNMSAAQGIHDCF